MIASVTDNLVGLVVACVLIVGLVMVLIHPERY
ncbi:MAG TPA: K(+)-transporting ATPase subunit F [Acidimicrobiaceae bacterium]|nr:K(+)-transporting ATPase subunit F [Acidimicrobiaceae bacterium]